MTMKNAEWKSELEAARTVFRWALQAELLLVAVALAGALALAVL